MKTMPDFKDEMRSDLKRIKKFIKLLKNKKRAVQLRTGDIGNYITNNSAVYWIEKNKYAIQMLKKERKLLKRKLNENNKN